MSHLGVCLHLPSRALWPDIKEAPLPAVHSCRPREPGTEPLPAGHSRDAQGAAVTAHSWLPGMASKQPRKAPPHPLVCTPSGLTSLALPLPTPIHIHSQVLFSGPQNCLNWPPDPQPRSPGSWLTVQNLRPHPRPTGSGPVCIKVVSLLLTASSKPASLPGASRFPALVRARTHLSTSAPLS